MKLKGAIIGFGKIVQSNHAKAFHDPLVADRAEITSAVEPNDENREICSRNYPAIRFYSSVDDLFRNEHIDFVDIAAPPSCHADLVARAIDEGAHILCEKPFVLGATEAIEIGEKVKKSELVFMPCHQYRYSPLWKKFKLFMNSVPEPTRALIQFDVFRTEADYGLPIFKKPWRLSKEVSGGGILADTGIHYLYLSTWLAGAPRSVNARVTNLYHADYDVEDAAFVEIELERAFVEITLTWAADRRLNSARITSHEGSISYEGGTAVTINLGTTTEKVNVPDVSDKTHYISLYASLFNEFIDRIERGDRSEDAVDDAVQSIMLLDSCYTSNMQQKVISLFD